MSRDFTKPRRVGQPSFAVPNEWASAPSRGRKDITKGNGLWIEAVAAVPRGKNRGWARRCGRTWRKAGSSRLKAVRNDKGLGETYGPGTEGSKPKAGSKAAGRSARFTLAFQSSGGRQKAGSSRLKAVRNDKGYSVQRRNSKAPLVPPKPKELDMAYSISALRAWLGTKSMVPVSGSWFSKLMVGGRI